MHISIRNSGGQGSEQVLASCGPKDWGRALDSVARFVLYSGVDRNVGKQLLYVERHHDVVV